MADSKKDTSDKTTKKGAGTSPEYIGPQYKNGLLMPDGSTIQPKEASAKKRKEMIAKYPRVESYFKNL